MRRCLELGEDVAPVYASPRTAGVASSQRREGVADAPGKARKIAAKAMTRPAWVTNHPPDLINWRWSGWPRHGWNCRRSPRWMPLAGAVPVGHIGRWEAVRRARQERQEEEERQRCDRGPGLNAVMGATRRCLSPSATGRFT
ncbi:hypothetical protein [Nonomuraea jabiensis]|uniref:hypothetical protein n=1 Tax=Nonomuraea jabiensis TaxID=882448 RepID=UPI003D72DBAE